MSLSPEELAGLVRRYRSLAAAQAEIGEEMSEISKRINDNVEIGWTIEIDGVPATKRRGRREFDLALAVAELTPAEREECIVTSFDKSKVRAKVEELGLLDSVMVDTGSAPQMRLR